jgi:hypothetical protein
MNFSTTVRDFRALLDREAPVILTGMAVSGACLTAYLAAKGAFKANDTLRNELMRREDDRENGFIPPPDDVDVRLTNAEKFVLTYKFYIPAAATLVGTSGCMIMATKIGLDRTAAMAAAAVVAERTHDQYKDKVKELLGENKHTKVVDSVAKDQVAAIPAGQLPIPPEGMQTFVDAWSGRAITSTRERIEKAVNDFNKEMIYGQYASLTEFYDRIGLPEIEESDSIGWNKDRLLELIYSTTLKDDRAVVVFSFESKPTATFRDSKDGTP